MENQVIALYKKGRSLRAIADHFKVSHEYIRSIIPEDVIRKKQTKFDKKDVLALLKKKQGSYQGVADELGTSRSYVYNIEKRYNVIEKPRRK